MKWKEKTYVSGDKKESKKSFGAGESRVDVLKGIDLEIEKGEFCVLLGPSGSGKSTLLNIIGGIDGADAGSITIQGERLEDMKKKNFRCTAENTWDIFFRCII
mgnify:CR=1 FL=1